MDFSAFPTSLRELRDKARVWAQENGLAGYAGYMGTRGKGDDEDQESALSWQREAFSSRIDMVGLNLNLPVRPVLLSGDAMEDAKEVLREAYRNEPLFRWLLGDVRKDNKGKAKENLLLEWLVDWRISTCARFSHTLAIPRPPRQGQGATFGDSGEQEVDVRGCAVVTYPGSKQDIDKLISMFNSGAMPPVECGTGCRARFAALEHMHNARDRLAGMGTHWYVHLLGVAPDDMGQGVGRMLMRIICALADQDALPVHLQVCGSRNRAFFEQCGFRAMNTVDVCSEDSPVLKIYHLTRVPFPKSIELT
eukprot:Tamp_18351.p1 GENE.Tamp_18351~~Tamp_18351.p1  ORF type:complete len:307 (-),score=66.29 Tamp_18351:79-999(-)